MKIEFDSVQFIAHIIAKEGWLPAGVSCFLRGVEGGGVVLVIVYNDT